MKRSFTLVFIMIGAYVLLRSSAFGVARSQSQDRTGSPVSGPLCSQCHNGGTYTPELKIALLDAEDNIVESVAPGMTYTLQLTALTGEGDLPVGYGFQATILDDANDFLGSFGDAPQGTQVTPLNDRLYWEHSSRQGDSTWQISWTAPSDMSTETELVIYSAVNAVNGNGVAFDDSDNMDTAALRLPIRETTSLNPISPLDRELLLYPTVVRSSFQVDLSGELALQSLPYEIFDITGQLLQSGIARSGLSIELVNVVSGLAIIKFEAKDGIIVRKLLKTE